MKTAETNLAKMEVIAGARPDFSPTFVAPYLKRRIKGGNQVYNNLGEPVYDTVNGTFYDLIRNPSVKISMNELRKEKYRAKQKLTGKKLRGKQKNIKACSLYHYSDLAHRAIQRILSASVPEEARTKVPKDKLDKLFEEEPKRKRKKKTAQDDFGGGSSSLDKALDLVPVDFYSDTIHDKMEKDWLHAGLRTAINKVRVKPESEAFELTLPIADVRMGDYLGEKFVAKGLGFGEDAENQYYKAFSQIKKLIGLDLYNEARTESFVDLADFMKLVKESGKYVDVPSLKKMEQNYIKGVRIIASPVSESVSSQIRDLLQHMENEFEREQERQRRDAGEETVIKPAAGGTGKIGDVNFFDDTQDMEFSDDDSVSFEEKEDENDAFNRYKNLRYSDARLKKLYQGYLDRNITIYLVTRLPRVEAEYYTQTPENEIKPTYVLEFMRSLYKNGWTPINEYYYPLEGIEKLNMGFEPSHKMNKEGLGITRNNEPYFIPNVNSINKFTELSAQVSETESGEYTFDEQDGADIKLLANQVIYTDWINNKLAYTDASGNLNIFDLEDIYELRPHAVVSLLNVSPKRFFEDSKGTNLLAYMARAFTKGTGENFLEHLGKGYRKMIADLSEYFNNDSPEAGFLSDLADQVIRDIDTFKANGQDPRFDVLMEKLYKYEAYRLAMIKDGHDKARQDVLVYGDQPDDEGLTKIDRMMQQSSIREFLDESPFAKPFKETIDYFVEKVLVDFNAFAYKSNVQSILYLLNIFARFYAVSVYAPRYTEFVQKDREQREIYLKYDSNTGDPTYDPVLPNVGDDRMLKHFQYRALSILNKSPEFSILAVDAGGGKTITIIANILQELEKGKVKRPLIICPGHLVKDYVGEVNYFNEAKMNVVVVNNLTIQNYGKDKMLQLINSAPPNTIFVADYGAFSIGATIQTYANDDVADYRYLDLYRQANFDGVWLDESHYIKNESQRYFAIRYATAEIPIKRLATGTLAPNRLKDIVRQFALFDPTVFGSETQFEKLLQDSDKGVIPHEIMSRLKGFCSLINIKRREWAASLPPRVQSFEPVAELTENQQKLYNWLCAKEHERLSIASNLSKDMQKILGKDDETSSDIDQRKKNIDEDSEETQDEIENNAFAELDSHLSHIEMFLSAPRAHPLAKIKIEGKPLLSDARDLRSPKADLLELHYREHQHFVQTGQIVDRQKTYEMGETQYYETDKPGMAEQNKILVFTNWRASVEHLYEDLAPEIRKHTLKYRASNKIADFADFKNKSDMKMMIGIGKSMNTGLNLQFCSRLIFVESVWSPGELEQSLARVFRPVKVGLKEQRTRVFINHLVIDRTIDVFKTSNLISKWVSVTKTMNADNDIYAEIPDVDELRLSLKNLLLEQYSFQDDLRDHAFAFAKLIATEHRDFKDFAEAHKGQPDLIDIKQGKNLEGSKILSNVPYVPGMSIYTDDDLTLIPYTDWKNERLLEDPDFKVHRYVAEAGPIYIHTEFGDGELVKEGGRKTGKSKNDVMVIEDEDKEDESSIFDEDGYISITPDQFNSGEFDIVSLMQKISENMDSTGKQSTSKKNVWVRFRVDLSEFDPKDLQALEKYKDLLSNTDQNRLEEFMYYTMAFDPDTVFVVANESLPHDGVRSAVIDSIKTIDEIQDADIKFKEHVDRSRGSEESKQAQIKEMLDKIKERRKKRKNKVAAEEERERRKEEKRKKQLQKDKTEEKKRGRGRPRKEQTDEYEDTSIGVEEERGSIELFIAQNRDMLSVTVNGNDADVDLRTLNRAISSSKFEEVPDYLAVRLETLPKIRGFLDDIAPMFEDGTPITPDTPVIKNPDDPNWKLLQGGRAYKHAKTGQKVSAYDFDNGYYVDLKSQLPKYAIEPESLEMIEDLYEQARTLRGKKRLTVTRETVQKLVTMRRQNMRKAPPGMLRCYPVAVRTPKGYFIYICAALKNNHGAVLTWFKTRAKRYALPVEKHEGELTAFYPKGNKAGMVADLNAIKRIYKISNKADVRKDLKGLIVRGRPSKKDEI